MTSSRPTNLGAIHDDYATLCPDKVALIKGETGEKITYREVSCNIGRYGNALKKLNVDPGDRVALFFPNELNYIYTFFGAMRIGAVPVPINIELPDHTLQNILEDCDAEIGVTSDDLDVFDRAKSAVKMVESIQTLAVTAKGLNTFSNTDVVSLPKLTESVSAECPPNPIETDDPALQPYTSGSTGHPKGVVLSHGGALWNVDAVRKTMMYDEKTRGLVATPMYHKNAMVAVIKPLLSCGGSTVILNGFETETVLRVIDEHDITLLTGVPTMYQLLLDDTSMSQYDISSVTLARCGSDAVPETLMNRFKKKFGAPLLENYGITEGGPSALCTPRWGGPKKAGSAGIPYPNSQTLIIDPETGEELPPGKPGELLLANPGLGSYYNLPEIEDEAFEERDNRQFLHTEDIAYVDEDGYHYIVGRLDDMMVVGGENVYPAEVEGLLERHNKVDDVIVVDIPHETKGEAPVAFVIPSTDVSKSEIKDYTIENGPAYAHPRQIFFIEEFPLTGAAKIDRAALKNEAKEQIGGKLESGGS